MFLRQSTSKTVRFGPFLDSTDGITPETGLTITQALMKLSKDGGALAQKNAAGNATHDSDGWYSTTLDATDTNTIGELKMEVVVSGSIVVWERWYVVEEAIYDALFVTSATGFNASGQVNVGAWLGSTPNGLQSGRVDGYLGAGAANVITSTLIATDAITNAKIAADAIGTSEFAAALITAIRDAITGGAYALDTNANGRVRLVSGTGAGEINLTSGNVDVNNKTGFSISGTKQTLDALNDISIAQVNAEVDTALSDIGATLTRMGYLDNLNTGGLVASQADISGITQAQRVRIICPAMIERPDAGNTDYRIWIYAYNELHQAEDLDSNPTVTAENNTGVDRSTNLGTVTKPGATTGIYYVDYNLESTDAIEGLVFRVTATEGAISTEYAASTFVVDTTAVDFTSADRAKLDTLHDTRIPDIISLANINSQVDTALADIGATLARMGYLDNINGHTPQTGDSFARLGSPAGVDFAADIAALQTDLDNPNQYKADVSGLGTLANQTTLLSKLLGYFQLALRSDAGIATDRATELTEINTDEGSGAGTFDNTSESQESIRDRGDAAWTTGGGGSITDLLNVQPLIPSSIDLADTVTWRIGLMLINALDDLPTTAEITPGTISIERKAIGATSWSAIVTDQACSEIAGLIYYEQIFADANFNEGDSLRFTFKNQKMTVAANDYEISDSNGRIFYSEIRQTAGAGGGDPWSTALPGAYGAGTAGNIVGNNLDATVSSRSSHTANNVRDAILSDSTPFAGTNIDATISSRSSHDDPDPTNLIANLDAAITTRSSHSAINVRDAILTDSLPFNGADIPAIKAKTDNLPSDPADASVISGRFDSVDSALNTIAGYIDTEISTLVTNLGLVKTKTDQLTFTIANKVDSSIQAANDFAQVAADKVWATVTRTLTGFGFSVTVDTNNDKTGYQITGTPDVNVAQLNGNATAAALLALSAGTMITGLTTAGTLTTTSCTTDITGFGNDALINRTIGFTDGNVVKQYALISDYDSASGLITFTDTPLNQAPNAGITVIIV